MSEPQRIVFAGTPAFAVPALEALASSHDVAAVLTQPDRRAGRGRRPRPSPVKQTAGGLGLPVHQPETLRDAGIQDLLRDLAPDFMVVVAYGLILPPEVLAIPRHGCLNIHASLLPRWRGAAPVPHAILAGDAETGVSIMRMDEGLDTGPVVLTRRCPIEPEDTAGTLTERLARLGAEALLEAIDGLVAGRLTPRPQPDEGATYARKLDKSEAALDLRRPAAELARRVRALNPWPVAQTALGGETLRVWEAEAVPGEASEPGTIAAVGPEGVDVATGDGLLRLRTVQLAGGRRISGRDLANARDLSGHRLGDAP